MLGDYLTAGPNGLSARDGAPQGMGDAMSVPAMMQQKKPSDLKSALLGGAFGILPMLLAGGKMGDFKGVGLAGMMGGGFGTGGLLSSLFK